METHRTATISLRDGTGVATVHFCVPDGVEKTVQRLLPKPRLTFTATTGTVEFCIGAPSRFCQVQYICLCTKDGTEVLKSVVEPVEDAAVKHAIASSLSVASGLYQDNKLFFTNIPPGSYTLAITYLLPWSKQYADGSVVSITVPKGTLLSIENVLIDRSGVNLVHPAIESADGLLDVSKLGNASFIFTMETTAASTDPQLHWAAYGDHALAVLSGDPRCFNRGAVISKDEVRVVFLIDTSGSMSDHCDTNLTRLGRAVELVHETVRQLEQICPDTQIVIITFDLVARLILKPTRLGDLLDSELRELLDSIQAYGGTDLSAGLTAALGYLSGGTLCVITDAELKDKDVIASAELMCEHGVNVVAAECVESMDAVGKLQLVFADNVFELRKAAAVDATDVANALAKRLVAPQCQCFLEAKLINDASIRTPFDVRLCTGSQRAAVLNFTGVAIKSVQLVTAAADYILPGQCVPDSEKLLLCQQCLSTLVRRGAEFATTEPQRVTDFDDAFTAIVVAAQLVVPNVTTIRMGASTPQPQTSQCTIASIGSGLRSVRGLDDDSGPRSYRPPSAGLRSVHGLNDESGLRSCRPHSAGLRSVHVLDDDSGPRSYRPPSAAPPVPVKTPAPAPVPVKTPAPAPVPPVPAAPPPVPVEAPARSPVYIGDRDNILAGRDPISEISPGVWANRGLIKACLDFGLDPLQLKEMLKYTTAPWKWPFIQRMVGKIGTALPGAGLIQIYAIQYMILVLLCKENLEQHRQALDVYLQRCLGDLSGRDAKTNLLNLAAEAARVAADIRM